MLLRLMKLLEAEEAFTFLHVRLADGLELVLDALAVFLPGRRRRLLAARLAVAFSHGMIPFCAREGLSITYFRQWKRLALLYMAQYEQHGQYEEAKKIPLA